jgi:hypothetical protein
MSECSFLAEDTGIDPDTLSHTDCLAGSFKNLLDLSSVKKNPHVDKQEARAVLLVLNYRLERYSARYKGAASP